MGSLYIDNKIESISSNNKKIDWKGVILEIFNDNKYRFHLNSELIDVDNRFRIVKINNKTYVVKKTTVAKARNEKNYAIKLKDKLNKAIVYGYKLKPIVPIIIDVNKDGYVISEYKGHTLQECLYDNRKGKAISFPVFSNIISLLLEKRIIYRGFIPRNIILKNRTIYMIDFEDISINYDLDKIKLNLQYKTNFILNWQYFYKISDLKQIIEKYNLMSEDNIELLSFEKCYKKIIGFDCNNYDLRLKIFNTVINAEKPCKIGKSYSYKVIPTDLVHLLSDLYGDYLDVIIDLFFENYRNKDELGFNTFINLSSSIIKLNYEDIQKLKKELFSLLIKSIKLFVNNKYIKESEINKTCIDRSEITILVGLFLKKIGSETTNINKQQLADILKRIGGESEVF